jgi:BRO family protein
MSDEPRDTVSLAALDEQASRDVRKLWHEGRWFFSVIDVVGLLTDNPKPRQYWYDMKRNIHDEGFTELSENIRQLKMRAPDGKQRLTDTADAATMLRIIQSIPSPKAEPFKQWLARVGAERLEEIEAPERAADRMRKLYRQRGYSDEWVRARLQSIVARDELTAEWRERGASEGREFAILTDLLHHGTFDVSRASTRLSKRSRRATACATP